MPDALLTVLGGVVVAAISALSMVLVSRMNTRGATATATTPPYDSLVKRLEKVETKSDEQDRIIEMLRDRLQIVITDRDSLVAYVKQWAQWAQYGAQPPPPAVPSHLRDLLDPDAWDVAHVTEHTTTTTYVTPPARHPDATD